MHSALAGILTWALEAVAFECSAAMLLLWPEIRKTFWSKSQAASAGISFSHKKSSDERYPDWLWRHKGCSGNSGERSSWTSFTPNIPLPANHRWMLLQCCFEVNQGLIWIEIKLCKGWHRQKKKAARKLLNQSCCQSPWCHHSVEKRGAECDGGGENLSPRSSNCTSQ